MPRLQVVEATLFDVDGVIVDSELLHCSTFNELLAPLGIRIPEAEWCRRFVGKGSGSIMRTLFAEHEIREDSAEWADRRRRLYRQRIAQGALHPIPGFLDLYASVRGTALKVAFVTSASPVTIGPTLRMLGLEGKHPVIDITQVHAPKPDPESYILAARILGVPPARCLVFEDSPTGVAAAKAAKMSCVALTTTNPAEDLHGADLILPDFRGWTIQALLARLKLRLPRNS
jgi:HAD superfamily hydrolase (TIGR01509 family)